MKEIEIGQGWHCFEVKKTRDGSSKPGVSYRAHCGHGRKIGPQAITAERVCLWHGWREGLQKGLANRTARNREKNTICLEQNNSNSRHHLGRMTGRSKIGSRSEEMISLSMARWQTLTQVEIFQDYQTKFISIYKWTLSFGYITKLTIGISVRFWWGNELF